MEILNSAIGVGLDIILLLYMMKNYKYKFCLRNDLRHVGNGRIHNPHVILTKVSPFTEFSKKYP